MQFKHVTLDFDGPVAILKLDHQEVMNAVSMDMLGGLGEALDAIDEKRDEVRCLVLTGAGRSFYFLQAFRRIGLVPDCGSTWLLPRMIGKARSVELSLMGERLPAEKALEWGLVNRVYDDAVLMEEAMKLAHELANGPTIALSLIRKLYWDSPENSFEEQLNLEFESQVITGAAEDFKEGVTAFLEKRPAKFKGK